MEGEMMTGNLAAAWGARLADVDYVPAFPITPQTGIIEALAGWIESGAMPASSGFGAKATGAEKRLIDVMAAPRAGNEGPRGCHRARWLATEEGRRRARGPPGRDRGAPWTSGRHHAPTRRVIMA